MGRGWGGGGSGGRPPTVGAAFLLGCWSILGLPVVMMGGEKANPKLMAESPLFRRMGSRSAGQGKWPHPTSSRKPCLGIRRASASPFSEVQTRAVPCTGTSRGPHRFRPPPPSCPFRGVGARNGLGGGGRRAGPTRLYQHRSDSYQRRVGPRFSAGPSSAPLSTSTTTDVGTLAPSLPLGRLFLWRRGWQPAVCWPALSASIGGLPGAHAVTSFPES